MQEEHKRALIKSNETKEIYFKQFKKLKQRKSKDLDTVFHQSHDSVFRKIKCLECSNCCKTTSPIFRDVDISRIATHLRMKSSHFIEKYLRIDEERDYVLKQSPCVFLAADNYCMIYEFRPLACKEYPHTNRKNMYQLLDLTLKNALICPAVSLIVDEVVEKTK